MSVRWWNKRFQSSFLHRNSNLKTNHGQKCLEFFLFTWLLSNSLSVNKLIDSDHVFISLYFRFSMNAILICMASFSLWRRVWVLRDHMQNAKMCQSLCFIFNRFFSIIYEPGPLLGSILNQSEDWNTHYKIK